MTETHTETVIDVEVDPNMRMKHEGMMVYPILRTDLPESAGLGTRVRLMVEWDEGEVVFAGERIAYVRRDFDRDE